MLGVIIPFHSRRQALDQAIASVGSRPIVVVDDSPSGSLVCSGVEIVRTSGEEGFAAAVNAGLEKLQSMGHELALLLNDDACLRDGALTALELSWCDGDGAIAPVLHEPSGPIYGISVSSWGRVRLMSQPGAAQALSGAALMLRSTERFDPAFRHGFEDIELCQRLSERGLALRVIDQAHCDHAAGATVNRSSRQAQRGATAGHLRLLGGGLRGSVVVGLGLAQVVMECGPADRLLGILDGIRDHLKAPPPQPRAH